MPKEIIWSRFAEEDLIHVIDYLLIRWSKKIADDFIDLLEEFTNQISRNPKCYPIINKKKRVHKCVVTKHNSLYYHEVDNIVEIIRLFDNRQNPKKLRF
jgi:plasmid stabilization system protein ParE